MLSRYSVLTQEAIEEVKTILGSRDYYLNLDNTLAFSQNTGPVGLALKYLTQR